MPRGGFAREFLREQQQTRRRGAARVVIPSAAAALLTRAACPRSEPFTGLFLVLLVATSASCSESRPGSSWRAIGTHLSGRRRRGGAVKAVCERRLGQGEGNPSPC